MSYSNIQVIGNLGGDPEARAFPDGTSIVNFSVAENRKYTKASGEKVEDTIWYRVSTFGKLAEICQKYLSKGRQVFISGRLIHENGSPRIWGDPPRASFEIRADNVVFLQSGEPKQKQDPFPVDEDEIPW